MATKNVRIDENIHIKIAEIAAKKGNGIQEQYEEFLSYSIKNYAADEMVETSQMEKIINNRLSKVEDQLQNSTERLASLLARVGIDNSMNLMVTVVLLEKLFKLERNEVTKQLRKDGVAYFTTATKEDKDKRKDQNK